MSNCPWCRAAIRPGIQFCTKCGQPRTDAPTSDDTTSTSNARSSTAETSTADTWTADTWTADAQWPVDAQPPSDAQRPTAEGRPAANGGAAAGRPVDSFVVAGTLRTHRSRVPVVPTVVAVLAVVALVVGTYLLLGDAGQPAATPGADSSSELLESPTVRAQIVAVDALLDRSSASRVSVQQAFDDVTSCRSLATARRDLLDAAAQRDSLVAALDALATDQVPSDASLDQLRAAWRASATADRGYAQWAWEVVGQCSGTAPATQGHTLGEAASVEATANKRSFVAGWNSVAQRYGLPYRSSDEI